VAIHGSRTGKRDVARTWHEYNGASERGNVEMTVSEDGAVVVAHGSTVVSHEEVNVDVDRGEVRSVDKTEVRAGNGNDNQKTK